MRAFMIDAEHQTITEIDFVGDDIKKIYQALDCESFTTGSRPLIGSLSEGFDAVYVSDDCLDENDDPKHWFQIDADRNPPSSFPITGRGLVLGTDPDGEGCDARISLKELIPRVTFTRRKFRGFKTKTGKTGSTFNIEIELQAPIIEEN
jgi:hypothetical protein